MVEVHIIIQSVRRQIVYKLAQSSWALRMYGITSFVKVGRNEVLYICVITIK